MTSNRQNEVLKTMRDMLHVAERSGSLVTLTASQCREVIAEMESSVETTELQQLRDAVLELVPWLPPSKFERKQQLQALATGSAVETTCPECTAMRKMGLLFCHKHSPSAWLVKLADGWRYLGSTKEDAERTQREKGGAIVPLYESPSVLCDGVVHLQGRVVGGRATPPLFIIQLPPDTTALQVGDVVEVRKVTT